jgi:DNA-binding NtrC family response regulator
VIVVQKILLLEREDNIRTLCAEELKDEGYVVFFEKNELEALKTLRKKAVDLLIADYREEKTDFYRLLFRLASEIRNIPIIVYSSYPRNLMDDVWWGETEYVRKSSDMDELKEKVKELLEYKRNVAAFYASSGKLKDENLLL